MTKNRNVRSLESPTSYLKIKTFRKLSNRADRYKRKLLKEGIKCAFAEGLETIVGEDSRILPAHGIFIRKKGEEYDDRELIELAKTKYPSLYRRYIELEEELESFSIL